MSRIETILIGTDESYDEIVTALARALDTRAMPTGDDASTDVVFVLGRTEDVSIEDLRLDDEPDDDPGYEGISYEVYVSDVAGHEQQLETARRVYDQIAAGTTWKVVLLGTDDLPVQTRPAITAASA